MAAVNSIAFTCISDDKSNAPDFLSALYVVDFFLSAIQLFNWCLYLAARARTIVGFKQKENYINATLNVVPVTRWITNENKQEKLKFHCVAISVT